MLTQKAINSVLPEGELSKSIVSWVAKNSQLLEARFTTKYPRSKNKFNVQLRNTNGKKSTLVFTSSGDIKVDKRGSYQNVLTWQNVRRLGCPSE